MSDRVRLLQCSPEMLARALSLPESTRITAAFTDSGIVNGPVIFRIEDESFSPLQHGSSIPKVDAIYESQVGTPKFLRYE